MPACAVSGCKNYNKATKGTSIKYFRFPREKEFLDKWINACKRKQPINLKNACICSIHFEPSCFREFILEERIDYSSKNVRNLRPHAIPTLHLHESLKRHLKEASTSTIKKERQEIETVLVNTTVPMPEVLIKVEPSSSQDSTAPISSTGENEAMTKLCINHLSLEDKTTQTDIENIEITRKNDEIKALKGKVKLLEEKIQRTESALSKLFTPGQIHKIFIRHPKKYSFNTK